jgi:hypothetical protein
MKFALLTPVWAALLALILVLLVYGSGPKDPPSAPSCQLAFPFMYERGAERKELGA